MAMPFIAMMVLVGCSRANSAEQAGREPGAGSAAEPPSCSVLGSIPYWAQDEAVESFKANIDRIDHLSLFWYHLDPKGRIRPYRRAREDRELIELAQRRGVKVLGLVANLPDDEREGRGLTWDPERVNRVLRSKKRRAAHIADHMALVRRVGLDGILVDYEALPRAQRRDFSAFVAELGAALRAEGKMLAVALHPKTSEGDPREDNGSRAQDWEALARHADQLHVMTYSQHTADGPPGPTASPGWMERVVRYAIEERRVPRDKLFLGLPLYAELWEERRPGEYRGLDVDLTFADVQARKEQHGGREEWSDEHQAPSLTYRDGDGRAHIVWFEDARSSQAKLSMASALGICNLALWRLGGEDPEFWKLLRPVKAEDASGDGEGDGQGDGEGDGQGDGEGGATRAPGGTSAAGAGDVAEPEGDAEVEAAAPPRRRWPVAMSGELSAEVEYYTRFAASDREDERDNWLTTLHLLNATRFGEHLALHTHLRGVLESDGEDRRFYSDFPHEGIYLRTFLLEYTRGRLSLFAGKYEPASGLRSQKPIFFGNYSTDLELDGRLGGGAALSHAGALGTHHLTGHWFRRDTTRLRGEIVTDQGRDHDFYGEVGEIGPPDSWLVTLHGGGGGDGPAVGYALGGGKQTKGQFLDETILFGEVHGSVPRGEQRLRLSLDALYLGHALGQMEERRSVGAGLSYSRPRLNVGATYSIRFVDDMTSDVRRTDRIAELVVRVALGESWVAEAAYQNVQEWWERENAVGVVVKYGVDWQVD